MALNLITGVDAFEAVGLQIVSMLRAELENQKTLAPGGGLTPSVFDFRVLHEQIYPLTAFKTTDKRSIINVRYLGTDYEAGKTNLRTYQHGTAQYALEVVAAGNATSTDQPDGVAIGKMHAGLRIVRRILMAAENAEFGLPAGLVTHRHIGRAQIESRSPAEIADLAYVAGRLVLDVHLRELSQEVPAQILEQLSNIATKTGSAEELFNGLISYT